MINKLLLASILSVSSLGYATDLPSPALQKEVFEKMGVPRDVQGEIVRTQAELQKIEYYIFLVKQPVSQGIYKKQIEALDFLIHNYNTIPNLHSKVGKTLPQLSKQRASIEFNPTLTLTPEEKDRFRKERHSNK